MIIMVTKLLNLLNKNKTTLLIIMGTIVLSMLISTKLVNDKEQRYLVQMREFKEQSEQATKYSDSLKTQINVYQSEARVAELRAATVASQARRSRNTTEALRQELDSLLETVTDSIEMARVIIPKQDSIITQQEYTISRQDVQLNFLNTALTAKNSALVLSNQRGDSLQRVVRNIPEPPKPSIFPTISRTQAFVGGTVVGLLLKTFVFK